MRRLPINKSPEQIKIIKAVEDFFGETNKEEKKSVVKIALWIMGRRKRNELTEEEKTAVRIIQTNIADKWYLSGL